jgi:hypothetical protein
MKRMVFNLAVAAAVLSTVLTSCKKDDGDKFPSGGPGVYAVGYESGRGCCIWKNGIKYYLNSNLKRFFNLSSVYVSGNDIYICGREQMGSIFSARLWKNGVEQDTDFTLYTESGANSVFVSGNDVYMAGETGNCATVSKNGEIEYRFTYNSPSIVNSVFVSDGNVYAAGNITEDSGTLQAILWVNGELQYLTNGTSAMSIFVSGNDVYVAGHYADIVKLWKNGEEQTLTDVYGYAWSVYVAGNDVYVAGEGNNTAKLWKNGEAQTLADVDSEARSVFVSGNDVYVAGEENNIAKIWKNGVAQSLPTEANLTSSATSIFVVP